MEHTASPSPAPSFPGGHPAPVNDMMHYPNSLASQSVSRYGSPMPGPQYDMRRLTPVTPESFSSSVSYATPFSQESSAYGPMPDDLHPGVSFEPQTYDHVPIVPRSRSDESDEEVLSTIYVLTEYDDEQFFGNQYVTDASSPPTPTASKPSNGRTLRSGTSRKNNGGQKMAGVVSGRVRKAAPKKKTRRSAADNVTQLETPLSQLKGPQVDRAPVADIATYVNRSLEDRREEIMKGKMPGKIKRPMNAFMLYRKAYQNRAKQWCLHNNHQVVSRVCGQSWPLEPDQVRQQFNKWAIIERTNHQKAHPDYKFTPAKPRKKDDDDDDRDFQYGAGRDEERFDWASGGSRSVSRSQTQTPLGESDSDYQPPRSLAYQYTQGQNHLSVPGAQYPTPASSLPPSQYDAMYMQHSQPYYQTAAAGPVQGHHSQLPDSYLDAECGSPSMAFRDLGGLVPHGLPSGPLVADYQIDPALAPSAEYHDAFYPSMGESILDPALSGGGGAYPDPTGYETNPMFAPDGMHSMLAGGGADGWQIETEGAQAEDWQGGGAEH
ncbi:uncharacterized protein E0L32_003081 [Thyridium curvatum]|uniref:HMG box domain-containing protein n=1 Tax=Thyridium curvatum TaxID=1093900 RepID=A0A507BL90_9PEZI|nr:uncharacterized protein E0L32_003081 [Thyridium curvatum]TPX17438.1 hypothetical protein E0L32_003081 [Thyridium curvatum]